VADVRDVFHRPRHPYTQGLIGAIPRVGGERARLNGIGGNAPSPREWPTGCRFHPRCPYVMDVCSTYRPEPRPVPNEANGAKATTSLVACHLYPASDAAGARR
jgi:peptide/nickel transport system ATP-binding protein